MYIKTQQSHSLLFVQMRSTLIFTHNSYTNTCRSFIHNWHESTGKQDILQESNNQWYIHMMKQCSLIKRNKVSSYENTWSKAQKYIATGKKPIWQSYILYDSKYRRAFKYFPSQAQTGPWPEDTDLRLCSQLQVLSTTTDTLNTQTLFEQFSKITQIQCLCGNERRKL